MSLLTVNEAAERLRKSPQFVKRELKRKNLRGALYGGAWHIEEEAVRAYIKTHMNVREVSAGGSR